MAIMNYQKITIAEVHYIQISPHSNPAKHVAHFFADHEQVEVTFIQSNQI